MDLHHTLAKCTLECIYLQNLLYTCMSWTIATPMTEFTVHSFLNGTFVVHVSKSGGLKELQDKIFQHTEIPSEQFGLYLAS